MTTNPVMSITDEQIAEIEADGCYPTADEFRALITRLREAEKDAARYRWLRDSGCFSPSAFGNGWSLNCGYTKAQPESLDDAVDTAMQSEAKP